MSVQTTKSFPNGDNEGQYASFQSLNHPSKADLSEQFQDAHLEHWYFAQDQTFSAQEETSKKLVAYNCQSTPKKASIFGFNGNEFNFNQEISSTDVTSDNLLRGREPEALSFIEKTSFDLNKPSNRDSQEESSKQLVAYHPKSIPKKALSIFDLDCNDFNLNQDGSSIEVVGANLLRNEVN